MISANEAKKRTQNVKDNYEKDLKRIEGQINAAICQGKFEICGTGYLSYLVITSLQKLGYKIEINNEVETYETITYPIRVVANNPYYVIKWS